MEAKSLLKLNSFALRIIAFVSMFFDHLGVSLQSFYPQECHDFIIACRYIGRLALPIFCLLIVEGVLHTRSYKKYATRLGIFMISFILIYMICWYVKPLNMQQLVLEGNIFIDLFLGSIAVYCLKNKNNYIKLIALVPLAYSVLSFLAQTQSSLSWFPAWLYMQYDVLSILLIVGFYLAYKLTDLYYDIRSEYSGISLDTVKETPVYRLSVNLFTILILVVVNVIYYFLQYVGPQYVYWDSTIQLASIATGLLLLLYNGQRGYDKKWFRIFSYAYYPAHIIIIYGLIWIIYTCTH